MHAIEMTLVQRIREKDIPAVAIMLHQSDMLNLDVNAWMGDERLLHEAVRSEDTEVVNLMLSHSEINTALRSRNPEEYTAFHLACQLSNVEAVKCFLDYFDSHGKIEEKFFITKTAKTALMIAAEFSNPETCKLLLEQKINVRAATLEGQSALDFAIARVKANHDDPQSIAVLKVLLMYGAAFCREVSALEDVMNFLDETEKCYFFESTFRGIKLTAERPAFDSATFFDITTDSAVKLICHDPVLLRHFSLRCMEFELNSSEATLPETIEKVKKMRRIFDFNKMDKAISQSGLSLQTLLSRQYGQQLLLSPLSEPVREVVVEGAHEGDNFSRDYEICKARIDYLSHAVEEMERSDRKRYGWSLGLSLILLAAGITGLVFYISKNEKFSDNQRTGLFLGGLASTIVGLLWAMRALKGLQGECVPNKLSLALNEYMNAEREKDERSEGMLHHQLTQYEYFDRRTVVSYLRELKMYFAELAANPASLHTPDNVLQGILREPDIRIDVIPDKDKEEVSEDDSENQENIDLIEMQPYPSKRF